MGAAWVTLVHLLAELEETLPHVTVDDLHERWPDAAERGALPALLDRALAEGHLFTDRRERLDFASGRLVPTRLIRLNRRHPAVAAALDAADAGS